MRICWLHEKLGAFGGAEANILDTAAALRRRGSETCLVFRERTGKREDEWERAFASVAEASDGDRVVDAVRRAAPDVIWIHNWRESGDFGRLRELGVPLARMVHDHSLYCLRQYKYHPLTRANCARPASVACLFPCLAPLQRGSGRWPLRWAGFGAKLREIEANRALDCLVVASGFMRRELEKNRFSGAKIRVLPPVPPAPQDPGRVSADGFEPGRMLFAGQVIRGKGVDLLLRALDGMAGDWRLAVAGTGSALAACQAMATRPGLAGRVEFLGHLDTGALAAEYRKAQVVVVPSAWQEPFGMVGVEAMRQARAVAAFDVGGIADWLHHGQNGLLAPAGDVPALRGILRDLLHHPEKCRAMGARGREIATQSFTFDGYLDSLFDMFRDLSGFSG